VTRKPPIARVPRVIATRAVQVSPTVTVAGARTFARSGRASVSDAPETGTTTRDATTSFATTPRTETTLAHPALRMSLAATAVALRAYDRLSGRDAASVPRQVFSVHSEGSPYRQRVCGPADGRRGNGMADTPTATPSEASSRLRGAGRLIATWPRRIAALAASTVVGWVVTQTLPALWAETAEKTGLAAAPVQVDVVMDPDALTKFDSAHNPEFVVQRPIRKVGPPPNGDAERGRFSWAKAMDGIDAHSTVLRLVIRGRADEPVILHALEVEKVADEPPLEGTLLSYLGQGAGQVVRFFDIDLDQDPAKVEYVGESGTPAVLFPYRVSSSELEVFDIRATTLKSYVKWRLVLRYSAAGKNDALVIDDGGRPFETTSGKGARFYAWLKGRWCGGPECAG
jgi:hypothetical protein